MMKYKQGDIVLLEVIFSNGMGTKKRPALIISSDEYHKGRHEIIIAAITSNIQRVLVADTRIDEWEEAGLKFPSLVTGIIQTVKKNMIVHKLGILTKKDFQKVQKNIGRAINF